MRSSIALLPALASSFGYAAPFHGRFSPPHGENPQSSWNLKNFTSLVAFGDSYTDDSRLSYFINNNYTLPPVGWVDPANYHSADGGRPWPQYVKQYTGANIYNYAVSGAVCSNDITPRPLSSTALFPDIAGYELPAFVADSQYVEENGTKFLDIPQDSTVYSMWIGTNDLGDQAFIENAQRPGNNLTSYTDCVYDQLSRLYDNGARYFVLQNVIPLQLAPLYGLPDAGGVGANQYWQSKPANLTDVSERMLEQVVTVDDIYMYRTPFEAVVNKKYPGAHFALFDVYGLFYDIYNNPSEYLNGTAPLSVTDFVNHCSTTGDDCVTNPSPDSFLWYDELHPSEQADRIVATNFVDVVKGASKWATYWSS